MLWFPEWLIWYISSFNIFHKTVLITDMSIFCYNNFKKYLPLSTKYKDVFTYNPIISLLGIPKEYKHKCARYVPECSGVVWSSLQHCKYPPTTAIQQEATIWMTLPKRGRLWACTHQSKTQKNANIMIPFKWNSNTSKVVIIPKEA